MAYKSIFLLLFDEEKIIDSDENENIGRRFD